MERCHLSSPEEVDKFLASKGKGFHSLEVARTHDPRLIDTLKSLLTHDPTLRQTAAEILGKGIFEHKELRTCCLCLEEFDCDVDHGVQCCPPKATLPSHYICNACLQSEVARYCDSSKSDLAPLLRRSRGDFLCCGKVDRDRAKQEGLPNPQNSLFVDCPSPPFRSSDLVTRVPPALFARFEKEW